MVLCPEGAMGLSPGFNPISASMKPFLLFLFSPVLQFNLLEMPEYNPAMANTFCSLNIHCIFSTKVRVPMLKPELRERLWPFLGGIAKQTVSLGLTRMARR